MISIPPYVPPTVGGISREEWEIAHRLWTRSLQDLLASDLGKSLAESTDLPLFIDTLFTGQLASPEFPEIELLKLVFMLYVRASALLASEPGLSKCDLFAPDRLLSFATVYTRSNRRLVRTCFHHITTHIPSVADQFRLSVDTISKFYASFDRLSQPELDQLLAMSTGLDSLFAASFDLARCFEASEEFMAAVVQLYDNPLTEAAVKAASENDKEMILTVRATKLTILSMFNSLFDACFFSHFGYATNLDDWEVLDSAADLYSPQETLETVQYMNNKVLGLIEQSGLDGTVTALVDAPLVLDIEIETALGAKISKVNRDKFHGEDEQLEFLVLSMEHLRAMSNTTESHQRRKQQMRALKTQTPYSASATARLGADKPQPIPDEAYVKMTAAISQIQDLFPDLGDGFVEACLGHFNGSVEVMTNHLLEDSLPAELANMDRSLPRQPMAAPKPIEQTTQKVTNLSLRDNTQLRSRRNVFDNDEFDVFAGKKVNVDQAHRGKANRGDANKLLDDKSFVQSEKESILQRIANIYEDEIDDTYDDVGMPTGRVDLGAVEDGSEEVVQQRKPEMDPGIVHESDLVHAYVNNVDIFDRSSASRRSPQRAQLKKLTGMTDEQLEGWCIMFSRNPRKQKILDKYALWDGEQTELDTKTSDAESGQKQQGEGRPPRTQTQQRNYKDKNKARFANHSRKKMHDKKMGKGMSPVG